MIAINNHEWITLAQDMFVYVNNVKKKIRYVYAGDKLVYPSVSNVIDLSKWSNNGFDTLTIFDKKTRVNDTSVTTKMGFWEKLYYKFPVNRNKTIIFDLKYKAQSYEQIPEGQSNTGICIAICSPYASVTSSSQELANISLSYAYLTRASLNDYISYSISYYNTQYDEIYLAIGFGYVRDYTTHHMLFKDVYLREE